MQTVEDSILQALCVLLNRKTMVKPYLLGTNTAISRRRNHVHLERETLIGFDRVAVFNKLPRLESPHKADARN
jgi:hypothetical protein